VQTIIAMVQRGTGWFQFWTWVAAAETAAWRIKWVSIPVLMATIWLGRKIYRSIRLQPERFCGVKYARHGLLASTTVALLIALLIGITVPARLRQREMAKEAAIRAYWHTFETALLDYRMRYHSYPADLKELRDRVPDPYGTLAEALDHLDPNGYHSYVDVAVAGVEKSRSLRGVAIRNASLTTPAEDAQPSGLTFTTFELRMPGEDGILGNDDDWIGHDGILVRVTDVSSGGVGRSVSAGALQP
jgi:hypothetical protein